jgi:hypothetical protein
MNIVRAVLFWFAVAIAAVALSGLTAWMEDASDAGPRTTAWRQA